MFILILYITRLQTTFRYLREVINVRKKKALIYLGKKLILFWKTN